MPRFAANLSMLYTELPFIERFHAAQADGFNAIECQFPYEETGAGLEEIVVTLKDLNLPMVLHNLPAGDWNKGDRGIACDPKRVDEFRMGVSKAIAYAKALGVPHVNCLAGILPEGISEQEAQVCFEKNLSFAANALNEVGIKLLIEPINTYDVPDFFLSSSAHAIKTIMAVKSNNLYLQYDAYHMHRMGENVLEIEDLMPFIDHIQVADHPGRNEPGTGEIPFTDFFMLLDDLAYEGWVGCEYKKLHRANFFA